MCGDKFVLFPSVNLESFVEHVALEKYVRVGLEQDADSQMEQEKKATGFKPEGKRACSHELVDLKLVRKGEVNGDLELLFEILVFDPRFTL